MVPTWCRTSFLGCDLPVEWGAIDLACGELPQALESQGRPGFSLFPRFLVVLLGGVPPPPFRYMGFLAEGSERWFLLLLTKEAEWMPVASQWPPIVCGSGPQ